METDSPEYCTRIRYKFAFQYYEGQGKPWWLRSESPSEDTNPVCDTDIDDESDCGSELSLGMSFLLLYWTKVDLAQFNYQNIHQRNQLVLYVLIISNIALINLTLVYVRDMPKTKSYSFQMSRRGYVSES